jgi:hypothetical protein
MTWLFAVTLFLSAALLFLLQPMTGKLVLPLLGGAPAVWNTCLVFFQATLLLGYAYAHYATRWLGARRQALPHLALLSVAALALPATVSDRALAVPPGAQNPAPWLLMFLALNVGLPFFAVSACAPLLQKWFAATTHRHARDPYFLYAASNAGSLLGLLAYPLLAERHLRVAEQSRLWAGGYLLLTGLVGCCAVALWRASAIKKGASAADPASEPSTLSWPQKLRWITLAFVPSSLMLGVTTYLSTDVAAFPLLWVVPLAIYLVTFILVFARRPLWPAPWTGRLVCLLAAVLTVSFIIEANHPIWLMIALHLLMFTAAAMLCHGELARTRPATAGLTQFYLCLSVGGVLGGAFNALVAPLVFRTLLEYPLVMIAACLVRPGATAGATVDGRDLAWAAGIGLGTAAVILAWPAAGIAAGPLGALVMFAPPVLLAYRFVQRPARFALSLLAVLLAGGLYVGPHGRALLVERNFFGVLRVTVDADGRFRQLVHGHTLHGRQSLEAARRNQPLAYYHREGPLGDVFEMFETATTPRAVGVVGLGTGGMAAYAAPDQDWRFYEIDPAVERIARDCRYFTFLADSRARSLEVALGDARLRLREAAAGRYGLLVLDAFSSDSVPLHLLTREALELYMDKLHPDGLLAFHLTNRRANLKPVLANLAHDAGLVCLGRDDMELSAADWAAGKEQSQWIVIARRAGALASLAADPRWSPPSTDPRVGVWTDDFSNILSVLVWRY